MSLFVSQENSGHTQPGLIGRVFQINIKKFYWTGTVSSSQLSSLKGHKSQELVVESCVFIFVIIIVFVSFNSAWRSLRYGQIFRFEQQVYVYIHFTCCKSRIGSLTQYHFHYNPIQFHCTIPHLQTVLVSAICHLGWVGEPD